MTIKQDALPAPSNYAIRRSLGIKESQQAIRRMHQTQRIDDELQPRVFLLTWQGVRNEVAQAIFDHYETLGAGSFSWQQPDLIDVDPTGIHVRWLTPPSVSQTSPITASVTGEFETVLALTPPT